MPDTEFVRPGIFDALYRYLVPSMVAAEQTPRAMPPRWTTPSERSAALVVWRSVFGSRRPPGGRLLRTKRSRKKAGLA